MQYKAFVQMFPVRYRQFQKYALLERSCSVYVGSDSDCLD